MGETVGQRPIQVAPTFIQCSPGVLWYGMRKPDDGAVLLVSGHASGPSDQRVYGPVPVNVSGTMIGATIGESNTSYRPTFVDIMIETSTAKVEKVLDTEEARFSVSVAELTAENMNLTIPGGTLSAESEPYTGRTQQIMKVGGIRLLLPKTVALISPNRRISAGGPYWYVFCGYNAIPVDGFDAPFARSRETVWKLNFELIAATERTIGDQLFNFVTN